MLFSLSKSTRLEALKHLLGHARACLATEIGFVLWDGSTVPDNLGQDAIAIAIGDEETVTALVRRPTIDTTMLPTPIPTLLVTCEEPGLIGCAALAQTMVAASA